MKRYLQLARPASIIFQHNHLLFVLKGSFLKMVAYTSEIDCFQTPEMFFFLVRSAGCHLKQIFSMQKGILRYVYHVPALTLTNSLFVKTR